MHIQVLTFINVCTRGDGEGQMRENEVRIRRWEAVKKSMCKVIHSLIQYPMLVTVE